MHYRLLSRPVCSLLVAQFLSALADNAIFIAAIALLKSQGHFGLTPMLQMSFLIAYVALAPYVGVFADGHSKNRVMLCANILKVLGTLSMLSGLHPLIGYAIVGIGAAAYSPAKYGILPELVTSDKLIKANGLIESSTIMAIIIGVVIGGIISDYSDTILIWGCAAAYLLSAFMNILIPYIPAKSRFEFRKLWQYTYRYFSAVSAICKDKGTRFCVIGTSTFWSVGATLRLILFAWVPFMFLNSGNELPSNLMGIMSVGVAVGALTVGLWIKLHNVKRAVIPGLFLGPLICLTLFAHSITHLAIIMVLIGACGGMFIIPLNAFLQENGGKLIGPGHTLAVQNFLENIAMLGLIFWYNLAQNYHMPLNHVIAIVGVLTFTMIAILSLLKFKS
ncbi:MAG: major facilitator superfamily 1 [Gammaproteobacteria bacterium]|jgi:LPLT family lysophospholipid transporter-like MFS transporter|nr:major facilitator superfamily 1 [Gammaproteobacteria bacterium]